MGNLTAVEFLADNLHYLHSTKWEDILIKAKEMEKEQMDIVASDWYNEGAMYMHDGTRKYYSFEQYYTQTFNK